MSGVAERRTASYLGAVPRKPTGRPSHRPIKDPVALARALDLVDGGMPATEAAQHPDVKGRVGQRTIYDALDRRKGKKPVRKRATQARRPMAEEPKPEPPPPPKAPPVPVELQGAARRLWIIRQRIDRVRDALQKADDTLDLGRISSLTGTLHDLMKQEAIVEREAEPSDPEAERRRWERASALAVKKIRDGVKDARERMAAVLGRPFPGNANVGLGG